MSKKRIISKGNKEVLEMEKDRVLETLVETMRNHPFLYDKDLPDYKNIAKKDEVVATIAKELKMTLKEAKNKLKYLRDCYVREKKFRETETPSGAGASRRKPFKFFEQMKFIDSFLRKRSSLNTLTDESEDTQAHTQESDEDSDEEQTQDPYKSNQDLDDTIDPDSPTTQVALKELFNLERQISEEGRKNENVVAEALNLFPSLSPVKKEPEGETPVTKKIKLEKVSHSLSPNLPILSDPISVGKKSKQKRDLEIGEQISKMVGAIERSVTTDLPVTQPQTPDDLLCANIALALKKVKVPKKRLEWQRKFRSVLESLEDELIEEEI